MIFKMCYSKYSRGPMYTHYYFIDIYGSLPLHTLIIIFKIFFDKSSKVEFNSTVRFIYILFSFHLSSSSRTKLEYWSFNDSQISSLYFLYLQETINNQYFYFNFCFLIYKQLLRFWEFLIQRSKLLIHTFQNTSDPRLESHDLDRGAINQSWLHLFCLQWFLFFIA